jgi:hypothetical protein
LSILNITGEIGAWPLRIIENRDEKSFGNENREHLGNINADQAGHTRSVPVFV